MDAQAQAKTRKSKEKFAEEWIYEDEVSADKRATSALQGKSRYNTSLLSHRPWVCNGPDELPPRASIAVLEYFKRCVQHFLSHVTWRRRSGRYRGEWVPPLHEWLLRYWDRYLESKTARELGKECGPLHLYETYATIALRCQSQNGNNSDWSHWEATMVEEGEQKFWNPISMTQD